MDVETCVQCIHLPMHTHYRKLSAPVFSLHLPLCIPGGLKIPFKVSGETFLCLVKMEKENANTVFKRL